MLDSILPLHNLQSTTSPPNTDRDAGHSVTANQLKIPTEELLDHPWKYLGYRIFSRWASSEKAFLIVRQFSTLNARIILSLQDDISLLEEQLDVIERSLSRYSNEDHHNGSFRRDIHVDRKIILEKIYIALKKYNRFVNEYTTLQNRPPAPMNDVRSVRRWLYVNHPQAISEEETRFIKHDEDLITVRPKAKSPVRRFFESSMWAVGRFPPIFQRIPRDPLIIDGSTYWYDDEKVETFASFCISIVGLVMFIAPFWALNGLGGSLAKLGLITGFVVLFYVVVALGTTARPFESLGAAAAYAAVLMVFFQASSNNNN